ncbi:hypothetical protein A3770_03p21920 [Chloropicon primus]|uniref:Uncharacterized protein n=1 Tax=Chloropicon primus TaxID=1764295 RepID=A0A5B8MHY6_9CHLO|nr:hypothetical protein A3770_03p21920 [Chloropicon primus]|eukprot:QDZ19674.1 hypothetical protein A3770_03p21920 [Chloropicon primus]
MVRRKACLASSSSKGEGAMRCSSFKRLGHSACSRRQRGRKWLFALLWSPEELFEDPGEQGRGDQGRVDRKSSLPSTTPSTHPGGNQFESGESKVRLTSGTLRQRVSRAACLRSLYWQLLLCLLAVVCSLCLQGVECNSAQAGGHYPAANSTFSRISDDITSLLPDQDCVFPYFRRYTGACVSHRYVNGQSFYYHVPKSPVGYVVLIHGAGVGRSEDWFVRINRIPMMKKLIDYGFAVSAVQSVAQWTMITRQRDLRNQDAAFWQIVAETRMDPSLPVFAVCVSRGCQYQGWMAETFEIQRRPLKAQYMSIPWGVTRQFLARSSDRMPPTIVAVGGSDNVPLVNTRSEMQPWVDEMRALGVEANLYVNKRRDVDDCFHSLCKLPETGGLEMTRELVSKMRSEGVIDSNGTIVIPLPAMQGVENPYERLIVDAYMGVNYVQDWPVFSLDGPMIDWIYQELSELQGGHRHTSDFDTAVLNMFLRQTYYGRVNALARREGHR